MILLISINSMKIRAIIFTWIGSFKNFGIANQEKLAREIGGQVEVVMRDGTRCDILSNSYAIEVDFAKKWAEAIGQSLHYALHTGKRPAVALIVLSPS